ncbi:uncharacterized protein PAC_01772 [Phialocephala subalpina]|uniref:Pentatricopeptide repeat protein n=1 Tax=Phialocephala subalpina TaxID=576137 RepID=A0A1L7WGJ2_9HELO|nr:uncharacterized protein PAC_01772 [Phialocephala subalpina]
MQVLWSRAAQARSSCRCSSCLHAATTLARSTTTAASKRRLRISDVFTACYSTILATAAFADARVKEDRRKEWDRLIEEAKSPSKGRKKGRRDMDEEPGPETDDWDVQKPQGSPIEEAEIPISTFKPVRDLSNSTYKPFVDDTLDSWGLPPRAPVPSLGHPLEAIDFWLRNSTAQRIVARDVDSPYRPGLDQEGQWIDEYFDPDLWNREPKKPLHLEKMEDMVASLVSRILEQSNVFSKHVQAGADRPTKTQRQMAKMAQRFIDLNIGENRWPQYKYDDRDAVKSQRKDLHQTLWALCFAASRGQADLDVTITKICYNLLISTAPPSITTYNVLLNEFMNMERFDLAQIIVDSFLNDSRLKPNKRTIRLFLDHYRARSDSKGFYNIIQRMRGTEGDMRLRKRHIFFLVNPYVESWATNNKIIHRSGYVHQKCIRSRPVYNSLILGSLEFGKVRAAIRYARAAIREGHEVSSETLCAVIKAVVGELDAYSGSSLLRSLLSQWNDPSMATITVYSAKLRSYINKLLYLCGIDPALPPSSLIGPTPVPQGTLSKLLWCMRLDSVADAVERSATFVLQLDATLGMTGLDLSYAKIKIKPEAEAEDTVDQRFEWALQVVRKQAQTEYRRAASKKQGDHESRKLRLRVLDKMVVAGSDLIAIREAAVLDLEVEFKRRESESLELRIESKKRELETLLCNKVPMDQRIAKKYVLALTMTTVRSAIFDDYPMFQQTHDPRMLPITYLERNLFDKDNFTHHQDFMSYLCMEGGPERAKEVMEFRIKRVENILDRYMHLELQQKEQQSRGQVGLVTEPAVVEHPAPAIEVEVEVQSEQKLLMAPLSVLPFELKPIPERVEAAA